MLIVVRERDKAVFRMKLRLVDAAYRPLARVFQAAADALPARERDRHIPPSVSRIENDFLLPRAGAFGGAEGLERPVTCQLSSKAKSAAQNAGRLVLAMYFSGRFLEQALGFCPRDFSRAFHDFGPSVWWWCQWAQLHQVSNCARAAPPPCLRLWFALRSRWLRGRRLGGR